MKYIIEIENEPFGRNDDPVIPHGMDELYRAKGFKSLVFDKNGLDKLIPYTEPDIKDVEDEVWSFAWKIFSMDIGEYAEIFDDKGCSSDYRETKAKYEAWLKRKDEIHVGDEVNPINGTWRGVVVNVDNGDLTIMGSSGISANGYESKYFSKTGRHFDEVEELLKKMGGEQDE